MTQPNDERPSDDVLEAGFPGATALLRMLVPHDDFGITEDAWRASLRSALDFGCDWLNHFPYEVGGNVVGDAVVKLAVRAEQAEKELERAREFFGRSGGCPCRIATPCRPDCSCVTPGSSRGCRRCFKYGSDAQRRERAKLLARVIDAGYEALAAHPQPAPSETPPVSGAWRKAKGAAPAQTDETPEDAIRKTRDD